MSPFLLREKVGPYRWGAVTAGLTGVIIITNPFSGEIVAIRSAQWRIWDLMWGLHIMDWVDRENIDNLLLKIFSFIALFTSISGVILFFKKS